MLGTDRIHITPELLMTIAGVDEFKGTWRGLEKHTTALSLLADVAAFGKKFAAILEPLKDQVITPQIVQKLHKGLVLGADTPAQFRNEDITLEIKYADDTETIDVAEFDTILPLLTKLLSWIEEGVAENKTHPLINITVFAAVFLQISPFKEGNHTLMRFLVTLYMMKAGYAYAPYISLDGLLEEHGETFARSLRHNQRSIARGQTDWSVWIPFFTTILSAQAQTLKARLNTNKKDLAHLPTLSRKVMSLFNKHERLQMKQIVKLSRAKRSTLKLRLGELVEGGYLRRYGQARSTWYALT